MNCARLPRYTSPNAMLLSRQAVRVDGAAFRQFLKERFQRNVKVIVVLDRIRRDVRPRGGERVLRSDPSAQAAGRGLRASKNHTFFSVTSHPGDVSWK